MDLTTAHSLWLAPLCLLLGVVLAWVLYRKVEGRDGSPKAFRFCSPPAVHWPLP